MGSRSKKPHSIQQTPQAGAKITQIQHSEQSLEIYKGPLPSPEHLAAFEAVYPGTADRILKMAESQIAHRQYLEKKTVDTQASNSVWGMRFAFILGMTTVLGGIYVSSAGSSLVGLATLAVGLSSLVGVFVYGKHANKEELLEKQKLMEQMNQNSQDGQRTE